jgi:hypothetical protein
MDLGDRAEYWIPVTGDDDEEIAFELHVHQAPGSCGGGAGTGRIRFEGLRRA